MATGLETFDALKNVTQGMEMGSVYTVNTLDVKDLSKLEPSELVSRGYDEKIAEDVCDDLRKESLNKLGESMGLKFNASYDASSIVDN